MAQITNNKSTKPPEEEPPALEDAMARLDQILERMEEGDQPLERLLEDYELGVGLIKVCQEHLSAAEQRIQKVTKSLDGSLQLETLDPDAP